MREFARLLGIEITVGIEPTGIFRISLRIAKPVTAEPRTVPAAAAPHES